MEEEMESNLQIRILLASDAEKIMAFARAELERSSEDSMDVELKSWTARWRGESLNYYLPQGWSFGAFQGEKLCGFLLGQPLLFYRGLTQTLWIEELIFNSPDVAGVLLETAYKWARDKHLQCVLLEGNSKRSEIVGEWKYAHELDEPMIEIRSSRF